MEETWMDVWRKPASLVTALLTVVISVSLATWISRSLTGPLEARLVRVETQTAEAKEKLRTAERQLLASQQSLEQLMRDQRTHSDNDAAQQAATESALRDIRAEVKMLRQAVFTMRPASRSPRR